MMILQKKQTILQEKGQTRGSAPTKMKYLT